VFQSTLVSLAADNFYGNFTGSPAAPATQAVSACANDGVHALTYVSHVPTCTSLKDPDWSFGALGITYLLSSLLYGSAVTDLVTFTAALFILLAVAVLACWMPARSATRVDPTVALHQD